MALGSGGPPTTLTWAFSGLRAGMSDVFGSVTGADTRIEGVRHGVHRERVFGVRTLWGSDKAQERTRVM
jgi:hypothetical protein